MTVHRGGGQAAEPLLIERAVQRVHASRGDLLARLLLAEEGDEAPAARLREEGPLYRGRDGSVVVTGREPARRILRDERFHRVPKAPDAARQYTLPCVDAVIAAESGAGAPGPAAVHDEVDAAVEAALRARDRAAELDLVGDVIRPVVAGVLCDTLRLPARRRDDFRRLTGRTGVALDAAVCPPRPPEARGLPEALGRLRELVGADGLALAVLGGELACVMAADAMLRALGRPAPAGAARPPGDAGDAAEPGVLFRDPPLRLQRLFAWEDVDLDGDRIEENTRVLVLNTAPAGERGPEEALASAAAALPRSAVPATAIAVRTVAALRGHLDRLRPSGRIARRLRAPVTRAVVRLPVAAAGRGVS
ncbi:cytochrome P450 family protein [Actinomadura sediminis]|uniref:P450-derived glycosyltransferase activator n=1 Tax=Actinomadura sediminis TaxID=1038904 RepID=A0ABW3ENE4_9ACTN